ncbi:MAG TPA: PstS family phosphate ABC transporter substrate-binding protein [Acidobacteriota bacterium]|nr:PstS family phosphate ABC transporter substrate-binding protein [Acidobacteriota bacterium]HRR56117.1 PstS family phosphate ABC transporter substrate-binding protein [Acidobacteriota bacterium]HRV09241.1 PstS family phosphate ABC transporter substrate-binding protein [Acidobacteriota bacterium]
MRVPSWLERSRFLGGDFGLDRSVPIREIHNRCGGVSTVRRPPRHGVHAAGSRTARLGRRGGLVVFLGVVWLGVGCTESQSIRIDGSSTVFPLTEMVIVQYRESDPSARLSCGISGTRGGLRKFLRGDIDVCDASRRMQAGERAQAEARGLRFLELPVALDGIVVAVSRGNDWCFDLSLNELRRIWSRDAQGRLNRWDQVRTGFPDRPLKLYGPGVDSGTYDWFVQAVLEGESGSRGDYTASENDDVLVNGVGADPEALGFFSYAAFRAGRGRLRAVAIRGGDPDETGSPVIPDAESIRDRRYKPLSRLVLLYVREDRLGDETLSRFLDFYLRRAGSLAETVGLVALPEREYLQGLRTLGLMSENKKGAFAGNGPPLHQVALRGGRP